MKVRDVTVSKVVRKSSDSSSRPGLVIVSFNSATDKTKVMGAKTSLRNDRQFADVYINHDQSLDERRLSNNLRTIVNAVNRGDTNLAIQGTRVVYKHQNNNGATGTGERRHNTSYRDNRPVMSHENNGHSTRDNNQNDSNRSNAGRDNTNRREGWTSVRRGGNRGGARGGPRTGYRGRN